ncbi:MAG: OmpA family protein [Natronospirillum sp.]|uniref:flagellar protein MotY n=1 Tax=Natronospirillum sp. TaxID=2812955 RepID=UPI0025ECE35E|nr:OmpA family protein [Natronospirillum sp.]MCH8553047.1 OmpA family protein [Natronospirillum sp.]
MPTTRLPRLCTVALAAGALVALSAAGQAQSVEFGAGLQNTTWELEGDRFACEFRQPIPHYGTAVFHHRAGEDLEFYIETSYNRMRPGYAALAVEAPSWRPSNHVRDLGYVQVHESQRPLTVETERALAIMAGLESGMSPTFTRQGRGMNGPVRLRVSPVGFRNHVDDYRSCITGLLPVNFDQVERTVVNYDTGVDSLTRAQQARLNDVVTYILNDEDIVAIYVEGHSDNQSTRFDGRRRSERRALRVRDYLVDRGVDPQIILLDYHGDRYPVASNDTAEGRAQNRRTTIRLERFDLSLD